MDANELKRRAAWKACEAVRDGMIVGLGTGSTAVHAVRRIGELVRGGMRLRGVPTSEATASVAREVGIPLLEPSEVERIDVTIDGADEVDPDLNLVKGLGAALLREKIVASITGREIIVVDDSKLVKSLGEKAPLPVEVVPFGASVVERRFRAWGWEPTLRTKRGAPVVTDGGNLVLDVRFPAGIANARELEARVNNVPGVVENGFFLDLADEVVVAHSDGSVRSITRPAPRAQP